MTETEQRISKGEAEKLYLTQRDLGKTHDESREYVRRETGHDIQVPTKLLQNHLLQLLLTSFCLAVMRLTQLD